MHSTTWRRLVAEGGVGLYVFGAVVLGAIAAAGLALDDRDVRRTDGVVAPERGGAPWVPALSAIDEALTRGDVSTALRTWSEAYSAALRSRDWEGLLAVGDARLRIDQAAGFGKAAAAKARESYLAALLRAGQEGSREGMIRAAEAFDALGDAEVAKAIRGAWGVGLATVPRERETLAAEP